LPLDAADFPPHGAHPPAQAALGEAHRECECRAEAGCRAKFTRAGKGCGEERERAPGGGEPHIGVESAAEPLQVVGGSDEYAHSDECHQPRRYHDRAHHAQRDRGRKAGDRQRQENYVRAIRYGIRSLMQLQFADEIDMYYVSKIDNVLGGLRTTHYDNSIRVDNVQHGLMAVLKILGNPQAQDVFDK